jgi:hypothetical protein
LKGGAMGNDISTMYTKDKNLKAGRKEYGMWKREKDVSISPAAYGDYILQRKRRKKKNEQHH